MKFKSFIVFIVISSIMSSCFSSEQYRGNEDSYITSKPESPVSEGDYFYKIIWSDNNLSGESISISFSANLDGLDKKLIVRDIPGEDTENAIYWNTSTIPNGDYYIFVMLDNNSQMEVIDTIGPVHIQHSTSCFNLSARENLISNNSFEVGRGDIIMFWDVDHANRGAVFDWVDNPSLSYSGNRAIMLANTFNGVNSPSAWEDSIVIKSNKFKLPTPGGKYLFTAWVKTENVDMGHVQFSFDYFDSTGQKLKLSGHGDDTFYAWVNETSDWVQVVFPLNLPHWDSPPYPENARAEEIEVGFSLDHSAGRLWVDDVSLVGISEDEYEQLFPGNHFPAPEIQTTSTIKNFPPKDGWSVSVQKDPLTGIWWLVDQNQKAFWGLGVSNGWNEKIGAATGLDSTSYSDRALYRAHSELNFNIGWRELQGIDEYSSTQNFMYWMNFSSNPDIDDAPEKWMLQDRDGNLLGNPGHYFPDVFSPVWQEYAIKESSTITKGGGWILTSDKVLGYFTDNEFSYGDLYDFFWGDTAKLAFVDWLQGKNELPSVDKVFVSEGSSIDLNVPPGFEIETPYQSIDQLNFAWSSSLHTYRYGSFEDIYRLDKPYIRSNDDPLKIDMYAFERVIYKIYVDTIVDNIRKIETEFIQKEGEGFHRPIFSNRFHLKSPAALHSLQRNMDVFSRFDVIAVNLYPTINQTGTFLPYEMMSMVKSTFYDTTGVPLFISEFGVASEDADNYDKQPYLTVQRWRKKTVPFEYQRGWMYDNLISMWANLPWVVGADWFSWVNKYGDPYGSDVRNSGLVNDADQYYSYLTNQIRSTNWEVNNILRSSDFSLEGIQWSSIDIKICSPEK